MAVQQFVPDEFDIPAGTRNERFVIEPLRLEHNESDYDADVRSWVRADRADLDKPLHDLVRAWLAESWPFGRPEYAAR